MKLLLDTHVWIWSLLDPSRLSRRTAKELVQPANELWLSPVSLWEAGLAVDRGQVRIPGSFTRWVEDAFARRPFFEAAITNRVGLETRAVGLSHDDPADRLIAATAKVYDLVLVTADRVLLAGRGFKTLEA